MKSAAKAFIILGIVLTFYLIVPLILGIIAIKKLDSAQTADELVGWGIVTLLFVSNIAGILMLCIKDSDLQNNDAKSKAKCDEELQTEISDITSDAKAVTAEFDNYSDIKTVDPAVGEAYAEADCILTECLDD